MNEYKSFNVQGVTFSTLESGLEIITVVNDNAKAELTTNGAHITSFTPSGERDLLWVSTLAHRAPGKPIRGGVPVCWPWFGSAPQEGWPGHGFVRREIWEVAEISAIDPGCTRVVFTLDSDRRDFPMALFPFTVHMIYTIGRELEMTLVMVNKGCEPVLTGGALHTYFAVSDVSKVVVTGLDKHLFNDHADNAVKFAGNIQEGDIRISGEIDRVYLDAPETVEIVDPGWGRVVCIEKSGSRSTVVWNPGAEKAATMADYAVDEYPGMLCIECANAADDRRMLMPGVPHQFTQKISLK